MADARRSSRSSRHELPTLHDEINRPISGANGLQYELKGCIRKHGLLDHPHVVRPCSNGTEMTPVEMPSPPLLSTQWTSVPLDLDQSGAMSRRKVSQGSTSSSGFSSLNRRKGARRSSSKRKGHTLSHGKLPSLTSASSNTTHSSLDENQVHPLIRPLSALSLSRQCCSLSSLDQNQRWLNAQDHLHRQRLTYSRTINSFDDRPFDANFGAATNDKCYQCNSYITDGTRAVNQDLFEAVQPDEQTQRPAHLVVMSSKKEVVPSEQTDANSRNDNDSVSQSESLALREQSGHSVKLRDADSSDGPTMSYSPISPTVSPSSRALLMGQSTLLVDQNGASATATPLPSTNDSILPAASSIQSLSNDSKRSLSSSTLIAAATAPSGEVDFDRLRIVLSAQRKAFSDQLNMEKAKREALQELLLELNGTSSSRSTGRSHHRPHRPPSQALSDGRDSATRKALIQKIEARLCSMGAESQRSGDRNIAITVEDADPNYQKSTFSAPYYHSTPVGFGYNLPIPNSEDSWQVFENGTRLYKSLSSTNVTSTVLQTPLLLDSELRSNVSSGSDSSAYVSTSTRSSSTSSQGGRSLPKYSNYALPVRRKTPSRSGSHHNLRSTRTRIKTPDGFPQLIGDKSIGPITLPNSNRSQHQALEHNQFQQQQYRQRWAVGNSGARTGNYNSIPSSKNCSPKRPHPRNTARSARLRTIFDPVGWYADVAQDGVPRSNVKASTSSGVKIRAIEMKNAPSLQDALEKRRPQFIAASRARLQRIAAARFIRQTADRQMRELAEEVAVGNRTMPQGKFLHILAQSQTSAFPVDEMIRETRKRYRKLPEYQQRLLDQRKAFDQSTNRVLAKMYKQRILYNVLKTEEAKSYPIQRR